MFQSNFEKDSSRPKGNASWLSDGTFIFGGNILGKESDLNTDGLIEIGLQTYSAPCIEGATCLADCQTDNVIYTPTFLTCNLSEKAFQLFYFRCFFDFLSKTRKTSEKRVG